MANILSGNFTGTLGSRKAGASTYPSPISGQYHLTSAPFDDGFFGTVSSPQTISPAFVSRTSTVYSPTLKGIATISPAFVSRTSTVYAPTIKGVKTLTPSLISRSPVVYSASVSSKTTISPAFVSRTPVIYAPNITERYTISAGFINRSPTVYSPSVSTAASPQTISPGMLARSPVVFNPTVVSIYTIRPSSITHTPTVYTPFINTGAVIIRPALAISQPVVFAPFLSALSSINDEWISDQIISAVSACPYVGTLADYMATSYDNYPAVIVTSSSLDGLFGDTSRNRNNYRFNIHCMMDRLNNEAQAEESMRLLVDCLIQKLNNNDSLNAHTDLFSRPVTARWGYEGAPEVDMRVADLTLEVAVGQ